MNQNYDVQQVCENGHQITDCHDHYPEKREKFCQKCSASTIIACPTCDKKIQGALIEASQRWVHAGRGRSEMLPVTRADVPSYCKDCGKPYPWTERKITAAIQILMESGDLDQNEKKTIEQDIKNVARDVPGTEPSARKINRIWEKYGPIAYEAIMELASRTAAKIFKGS